MNSLSLSPDERSHPVYAYQLNRCGPTHIIVGDGGNNEGVTKSFFDTSAASKKWCKPGNQTLRGFPEYQPQACFTLNPDGQYCDFSQPTWSAYRNPSWGFGVLTIFNETTAHWIWNNTDGLSTTANVVYDEVYFTRNSNSPSCPSGPRPAGRRLRMKKRV